MNVAFFLTPKSRVAYLNSGSSFRQGLEKLRYHGYTAIPVLDDEGVYVGTLREGDFLWSIVDMGGADLFECEHIKISEILVPDRNPPVRITAKADELLERLLSQNFVPVVDDRGVFMGIVTRQSMLGYYKDKTKNT